MNITATPSAAYIYGFFKIPLTNDKKKQFNLSAIKLISRKFCVVIVYDTCNYKKILFSFVEHV